MFPGLTAFDRLEDRSASHAPAMSSWVEEIDAVSFAPVRRLLPGRLQIGSRPMRHRREFQFGGLLLAVGVMFVILVAVLNANGF